MVSRHEPSSSRTRRCSTRPRSCTSASRPRSRACATRLGARAPASRRLARTWHRAESYEKRAPADTRVAARPLPARPARETSSARCAPPSAPSTAGASRRSPSALRLARRAAALIEERVYEIAAALALEVGKNRMEALGEAQETADFFTGYATSSSARRLRPRRSPTIRCRGFALAQPQRPEAVRRRGASSRRSTSRSRSRAARSAAALVTGNTVVLKGATDTPWAGRLLADCIRDAGFPPGVFNYVTAPGRVVGEALVEPPAPRRHHLHRLATTSAWASCAGWRAGAGRVPASPRWAGKNAVHRHGARRPRARGDRHRALGLRPRRPEVLGAVAHLRRGRRRGRARREARRAASRAIRIGDPTPPRELDGARSSNAARRESYERYCERLARDGGAHPRGRPAARRTARSRTATSWRPRSPRRRPSIRSCARRCSCRS